MPTNALTITEINAINQVAFLVFVVTGLSEAIHVCFLYNATV